jgi:hypothetical protein
MFNMRLSVQRKNRRGSKNGPASRSLILNMRATTLWFNAPKLLVIPSLAHHAVMRPIPENGVGVCDSSRAGRFLISEAALFRASEHEPSAATVHAEVTSIRSFFC